jgi:ferritin
MLHCVKTFSVSFLRTTNLNLRIQAIDSVQTEVHSINFLFEELLPGLQLIAGNILQEMIPEHNTAHQ